MPNQYTTATDPTPPERFWSKVEFTDTCWLWRGSINPAGYGQFALTHGNPVRVHRYAYEFCIGPIPEGLTLDHLCHNEDQSCVGGPTCLHRSCVKPEHLEPVTTRINILRGKSPSAVQARKTHCLRGHPFSQENTYYRPDGWRECRVCRHTIIRRYKARKKAAA